MLQFSAHAFFWCGAALRSVKNDCLIGSLQIPHDEPMFALSADIDDRSRNKAIPALTTVEAEFRKIGLVITADTTKELIEMLRKDGWAGRNFQWLMDQVTAIEKLSNKELQGRFFLYIPPERAKFWPTMNNQHMFGKEVSTKFPSADFDIGNGGVCIAVMMSTASVFHMMRVLEIGLAALGKKFGVSLAHTNWAPAIEQIESKIRNMHKDPAWNTLPDCKEQQEYYAQAASHFGILKDAWRNYTMHVRGKYTELEAERIFENVKSFMQKLAERLAE